MSKKALDKIAEGLRDAIAFAKGNADPSRYRVHTLTAERLKSGRESRRFGRGLRKITKVKPEKQGK